jgi:mono/diheme cytochrome c family protein
MTGPCAERRAQAVCRRRPDAAAAPFGPARGAICPYGKPLRMANAAQAAILIATFLLIHAAQAADPASGTGPPAPDGAQLFATYCAMCHQPEALARRLQRAADPRAAEADMAAFLARHGRSDAEADARIIDYLAHRRTP